MNVRCEECSSMFRVDPGKVPAGGVRARCSVCGGVIRVHAPDGAITGERSATGDAAGAPVASAARSAAAAADDATDAAAAVLERASAGVGALAETPAAGPSADAPSAARPVPVATSWPTSPDAPAADRGDEQRPVAASGPDRSGASAAPETPREAAPPAGAPAPSAAAPATPTVLTAPDAAVTPIWSSPTDVPAVRHTPSAERLAVPPGAGGRVSPTPPAAGAVGPRITPRIGAAVPPAAGRRPINPYLNADPQQKARRLARALVSDIVAYHPQKREEGLRTGALKQLFRDEIKKSYEEYVEQVGKELADTTTHFQDALNDVLAGGRRIF